MCDTSSSITFGECDESSTISPSSFEKDEILSTDESSNGGYTKIKINKDTEKITRPLKSLEKIRNDIRQRALLPENLKKIRKKLFYCPPCSVNLNSILEVDGHEIIDILKKIKRICKISNKSTKYQGLVDYIVVAMEQLIKKFGEDLEVVKCFGLIGIENNQLIKKVEKIEIIMKILYTKLDYFKVRFQSDKVEDVFIYFLKTVENFIQPYYITLNSEKYKSTFPNLQSFIKSIQEIVSDTEL